MLVGAARGSGTRAEQMKDLRDMNRHYCATCKHMTEHICMCTACGTTIGTPPERDAANDGGLMRDAGADCRAALPSPAKSED